MILGSFTASQSNYARSLIRQTKRSTKEAPRIFNSEGESDE
jgi:hypothetical protein